MHGVTGSKRDDGPRSLMWVPTWARQLRSQLTAAGVPLTPMWVKRGDALTHWGDVWGLRGRGSSGSALDVFMDHYGAVWSLGHTQPAYLASNNGVVAVPLAGGGEMTFPAEHNAFVVEYRRPVRADEALSLSASVTLEDEVAKPVMQSLSGALVLSGGMIVGSAGGRSAHR